MSAQAIGEGELKAIVGDIDEAKAVEILKLQPTLVELEEAAIWAAGDGDILGKTGHPLAGKVADIVDILTADEDEPPPVR